MSKIDESKRNERLEILAKIDKLEKEGGDAFFEDVENDPPYNTLNPDDVDYLYKKTGSKIKRSIAYLIGCLLRKFARKEFNIQVEGMENLEGFTGSGIFTSNHFNYLESGCVSEVLRRLDKKKKLYIVIREGNYAFKGLLGLLFKYCDTLPLSSNLRTMANFSDAVKKILKKEQFILVYPEQSMWWNYKKPRPHKTGAAYFAAKNNVPIIPCFVTMSDQEKLESNGFPVQNYTIHVMNPIYPNPDLSVKENAVYMSELNYKMCIEKYEEVYNKKLVYGEE